jgi:hypothetical protein
MNLKVGLERHIISRSPQKYIIIIFNYYKNPFKEIIFKSSRKPTKNDSQTPLSYHTPKKYKNKFYKYKNRFKKKSNSST